MSDEPAAGSFDRQALDDLRRAARITLEHGEQFLSHDGALRAVIRLCGQLEELLGEVPDD